MIETRALVLRVDGGCAMVATDRTAGCGHCESVKGCASGMPSRLFCFKSRPLTVLNPVGAEPGERVVIGIQDGVLLKSSIAAYLMPLALLLFGALAGAFWVQNPANDAYSALGALIGLGTGLAWMRLYSMRNRFSCDFQPYILNRENAPLLFGVCHGVKDIK